MSVVVPDENRKGVARARMNQRQPTHGAAASAPGNASPPSVALAEALRDPVASVRQAAAEALGSAKDSVAVRALMEVLRTDESPMVRRAAAWSLGEIGERMAIPALSEALARDRDAEDAEELRVGARAASTARARHRPSSRRWNTTPKFRCVSGRGGAREHRGSGGRRMR